MAQTDYSVSGKSEKPESKNLHGALLPKSIFPSDRPLAPGDTCTFKIEKVYNDQVSVSYVSSGEPDLETEMAGQEEEDEMD